MTDRTQPEALRLADELAQRWGENMACPELEAAAELRRLHAENERLSGLCDKWNSECDEFREDNKRLAALVEAQQHTRIAELEAARFAYASEFDPNGDGYPDVGSIHANIRAMKAKLASIGAVGVQALSAAPNGWESVIDEARSGLQDSEPSAFDNSGYRAFAETVLDAVEEGLSALAASPTPPAEQRPGLDEDEALDLLAILFDAWEDGTPCYEDPESSDGYLGQAFRLDDDVFHRCSDLLNRRRSKTDTPPAEQPDLSKLTERGDVAWAGVDAQALRDGTYQAAPKAAPGEQFDSEGFRAWVRKNLPDDTIIGNSAWWADHLTTWAQRFVKAAPQQEAQEPALFVSAKQLADLVDPSHATGGSYLPARKTRAGLFTQPLYTTPQPAPAPLSEREAFEAWIKKDGGDLSTFGTTPNMHYRNGAVNNAWVAWKARAAIAAQGGKA